MSIDMIIMLASTVMGFVFKMMANSQKDKQEHLKNLTKQTEVEGRLIENARGMEGGTWIRRFIVFVSFVALFWLTVGSGYVSGPTSMILEIEKPSYFFGLFGGGTEQIVKEIKGMVYSKDITNTIYAILGFYFGQASASRK